MRSLLLGLFLLLPFSALACENTERTGAPLSQTVGIEICRSGYELLYRPEYKTAYWSAEHIEAAEVAGKLVRVDAFQSDPLIPDNLEAQLSDYVKSGYSRGHLAPVGDFRRNPQEAQESFYLSNMVPQWQTCNNAGVWSQIERVVRDWAVHYKELYVVTGPIYSGPVRVIGRGVRIPDAMYKVVWNPTLNQTLAFIVPNIAMCGSKPNDFFFKKSQVELQTNIRFFPKIQAEDATGLWQ